MSQKAILNSINQELLRRVEAEITLRRARTSLEDFVRYTKPDYLFGWFNEELCAILDKFIEDVINRKSPRLLIKAPPRHGKSELVSRRFPAYILGRYPWLQVMNASYSAELASAMNRDVQAIMDSPEYNRIFPNTKINGEMAKLLNDKSVKNLKKTADFVETNEHGYLFSGGVGGAFTGFGSDVFINDDLIKNREEADSQTIRDKVWNWYTSTAYSRLSEGGGMIIMMTAWHSDDLTGRVIDRMKKGAGDNFTVFEFPAIATKDEKYRKIGEPLHPERFSLAKLEQIRRTVGIRDWSALYQQSPIPDEGGLFKPDWIQYYDELPRHYDKAVMSWDMTFKDTKTSDYVCGQVWIKEKSCYYLVDQIRGRFDFTTTLKKFIEFSNKHPYCKRKLIEDKANGTAVINTLKKHISGIVPITPKESKVARASATSTLWEAHNIYIPDKIKNRWVELEYEDELLKFPGGLHDDQVDCTSQALNDLMSKQEHIDPSNVEAILRGFYG